MEHQVKPCRADGFDDLANRPGTAYIALEAELRLAEAAADTDRRHTVDQQLGA